MLCLLLLAAAVLAAPPAPPTLDDFWAGAANFAPVRKFAQGAPGFPSINAGTRVVARDGAFYLFGRADNGTANGGFSAVVATNGTVLVRLYQH